MLFESRVIWWLGLLGLAAIELIGCTAGYGAPERVEEQDPGVEVVGEDLLRLVPAPERDPQPAPARPVVPPPRPELDEDSPWGPLLPTAPEGPPHLSLGAEGYAGPCEFGLVARGLPAINRETGRVINVEYEREQGPSDYDESRVLLVWRDFDDGIERSVEIYDALNLAEGDYEAAPRVYCARARRSLERRLPQLNALLDAEPLESMARLPVQTFVSHYDTPPLAPRGSERPVELSYRGGELVARIRGVRVLHRQAHADWQGPVDTLDAYNPNILAAYGDRQAQIAVVERSYESASCMSDTQTYAGVTRLPESVFAEIELRAGLALIAQDI